ncbi:MAG: YqeG family HAD IIIA-type phosphatase [Lachnospiraceae bacterium]|nr:YqeG family HAD IIIA-type phosphatase [Lachnospiraceae bacterium]
MFKAFYPDEYKASAYKINYERLFQKGYRGIIYDIDNTLVPHDAPANERAIQLFRHLEEMGFKACFMSNNQESRVKSFNEKIGIPYIFDAKKPMRAGYMKAMRLLKTKPEHTLCVGDQLFTDVWGAYRAGIYCILVKPIDPKEKFSIVLKRYLEKIVLYFYQRSKSLKTDR